MRTCRRDENQLLNRRQLLSGIEFTQCGEVRLDVLHEAVALGAFELNQNLLCLGISLDTLQLCR